MRTIRFYFDFISPYAYLAWTQIEALAKRANVKLEPIPILFAALLDSHGQKGPAEIAPKRLYMYKDVLRRAYRLGIPLKAPAYHPFNPLLALRIASIPLPPVERMQLIDRLFAATWGDGSGVENPEQIAAVISDVGLDPESMLKTAATPEIKNIVRQHTEEALAAGVFGVPTMIVGDELFWGADSLESLEAYLGGFDPLQKTGAEEMTRWMNIVPSAVRRSAGIAGQG